jgi:hypothetical protein
MTLDSVTAAIIATALAVMAGGGYLASLGKGGRGTMVALSIVLLAVAYVVLLWRSLQLAG